MRGQATDRTAARLPISPARFSLRVAAALWLSVDYMTGSLAHGKAPARLILRDARVRLGPVRRFRWRAGRF
jgi:hypothetical protein